ncbi:Tigger transposable element-derived protein [Trichinella pseudospiralis]
MSTTEKGKVLSFEQKLEVYQQLNSGESFRKIAENFGMDVSTITDICRSRRHLTLEMSRNSELSRDEVE